LQKIAEWLETLGMSEYATRFAENGIDVSVLRYLTDQDLEKIGVLLGHRRKMLAAIAERADSQTGVQAAHVHAADGYGGHGRRRRTALPDGDVL
jgi:hypothetical protein